jgi:hypothetical protein
MIIQALGAALFLAAMWAALQFEGMPVQEDATDANLVQFSHAKAQLHNPIRRPSTT